MEIPSGYSGHQRCYCRRGVAGGDAASRTLLYSEQFPKNGLTAILLPIEKTWLEKRKCSDILRAIKPDQASNLRS